MGENEKKEVVKAFEEFRKAWLNLFYETEHFEADMFSEKYPFEKCFLEKYSEVKEWAEKSIKTIENMKEEK